MRRNPLANVVVVFLGGVSFAVGVWEIRHGGGGLGGLFILSGLLMALASGRDLAVGEASIAVPVSDGLRGAQRPAPRNPPPRPSKISFVLDFPEGDRSVFEFVRAEKIDGLMGDQGALGDFVCELARAPRR